MFPIRVTATLIGQTAPFNPGRETDMLIKQALRSLGVPAFFCVLAGAQADEVPVPLPTVTVYLPGLCLSCMDWADHLRSNGFTVQLKETADMPALKRSLKVPVEVESVHSAVLGGYFIEGHVPAEDIKQFLAEKPKARGIAVPGLPAGAPGRENSSPICETACTILDSTSAEREIRREMYDTLLVLPNGKTKVFARH